MAWYGYEYGGFPRYVPVAERRAKAQKQVQKLRKQGKTIEPVSVEGRTIARSFWGKGWCDHLESFSDYDNRLPRGRTYVRNGSVCHLAIQSGKLEALVSGSQMYTVEIRVRKLKSAAWEMIKQRCAGQVGSMLELLQGKLSDQVMQMVTHREDGLFPQPGEIQLKCSCPDWATMCKHVAAVLYGVGSRLDDRPELLFTLRGVDAQELIATELTLPASADTTLRTLADDQISDVFGIDLDDVSPPASGLTEQTKTTRRARKHKATKSTKAPRKLRHNARKKTPSRQIADRSNRTPNIRPTGKSVARLRRQLGLSVADFARQLGVTSASVYRWESTTGRLQLQPRSLRALASLRQRVDGS